MFIPSYMPIVTPPATPSIPMRIPVRCRIVAVIIVLATLGWTAADMVRILPYVLAVTVLGVLMTGATE